jgi:hemoglobin
MSRTSPSPRTDADPGGTPEPAPTGSDYAAIGGAETIRNVVDRFYALVLGDPELAGYFVMVDLARLKRHQVLLLAHLLGGPDGYDGRDLAAAHAGLWIGDQHFRKVGEHLGRAMSDAGVGERVTAAIAATLETVRDKIVTAQQQPD